MIRWLFRCSEPCEFFLLELTSYFLECKGMLLYRLQSHSNFYLHLKVFSLKYLIFGNHLSSHALGVNALLHWWYFPGDIRYLFAEYITAYTHITSWSVEIPSWGFFCEETGMWHATVSLIVGILTEISVNITVIFWRCLCSWSRQWVWTNTVPRRILRVTIN